MKKTIPVLLLVGLACPAQAATLTLQGALNTALTNNLSIQDARIRQGMAEEKVNETISGAFPQVSLSTSGYNINMLDSSGASSLMMGGLGGMSSLGGLGGLGGLSGLSGLGGGAMSMVQSNVSVSQVLFDGFRTRDGLKLAKLGRESAELDTYNAQQTVLSDAMNAYLNVLRMESLMEVSQSGLKSARLHLEQAQNRVKSGMGTRFEVLQAQTQLSNVRGQVRKTQNALELSRLSLFNTLRVPASADKLEQLSALPTVSFDERDLQSAIDGRSEIHQILIKQGVDKATLDLNGRSFLPTIAGMGNFSMQGTGTSRYWLAGITAQWSLFDGGKTNAKLAQNKADLERDKIMLEQTRNLLILDTQKSLRDRAEATDRLEIAEEGLNFAKESYRLAEARYASGVGTSLEVIDSQSSLTQAQQNRIGAYYDLQLAEVKLARSLGIDLREYLPGIRKG